MLAKFHNFDRISAKFHNVSQICQFLAKQKYLEYLEYIEYLEYLEIGQFRNFCNDSYQTCPKGASW